MRDLDLYPNQLTVVATPAAANSFVEVPVPLPTSQLISPRPGYFYVVEILKIFYNSQYPNFVAATNVFNTMQLSRKAEGGLAAHSTYLVGPQVKENVVFPAVMANNASLFSDDVHPIVVDLTDGQGHGLLVSAKTLYLGAQSQGSVIAQWASARILWRLKLVSADELLGLTQE